MYSGNKFGMILYIDFPLNSRRCFGPRLDIFSLYISRDFLGRIKSSKLFERRQVWPQIKPIEGEK